MKLKRYCVTVLDHWTPTQEFWTLEGAKTHLRKHKLSRSNLFKWDGGKWVWMCGASDLDPSYINRPYGASRASAMRQGEHRGD